MVGSKLNMALLLMAHIVVSFLELNKGFRDYSNCLFERTDLFRNPNLGGYSLFLKCYI